MVLARRLKAGDALLTIKGPAKVTRVEQVPPKPGEGARVFNLDVGDATGGKPALTDTNRTFYAAGNLVGDNYMQRRVNERIALNVTEGGALPVPKEWAAEYALARKLAAEKK